MIKLNLSQSVVNRIVDLLPTPRYKGTGRPHAPIGSVVTGVLIRLLFNIPWYCISPDNCSGITCYRYFREIQRRGLFKNIFYELIRDKIDASVCSIDTTVSTSFRFKFMVSFNGKHKKYGTKISLIIDRNGLPVDVVFDTGKAHDLKMLGKHTDRIKQIRVKLINLDKGYTSIKMRRDMRLKRIKINMETRRNDYTRKRGPKFSIKEDIYKQRFEIEQKNAWIKGYKAVRHRLDRYASSYKGMVYMALIVILVKHFEF